MTQRAHRVRRQMSRSRAALNRPSLPPPPAPPVTRSVHHVCVVQTYMVGGDDGHYQIHVAADDGADAVRTILLTKDPILYDRALRAEGLDRIRFAVAWHTARRSNGKPCLVLDRLDEEPT
jgi:hypothetical protein